MQGKDKSFLALEGLKQLLISSYQREVLETPLNL